MENRKRCQVHMLPTEDGVISKCLQGYSDDPLLTFKTGQLIIETDGHKDWWENQHLYFTTSEKIKEGNWCLKPVYKGGIKIGYGILQADSSYFGGYGYDWEDHHKIISSTDPKLINKRASGEMYPEWLYDVAQPSQEFTQSYCEQGGFNYVDVEYEIVNEESAHKFQPGATIINHYLKLKIDPIHNTITTHRIVEKMYSREEVEALIYKSTLIDNDMFHFDKWIQENL